MLSDNFKHTPFNHCARVNQALSNGNCHELPRLIGQGERSVDKLGNEKEIVAYCCGLNCELAFGMVDELRKNGWLLKEGKTVFRMKKFCNTVGDLENHITRWPVISINALAEF